jgi:diguanylate cyclase (GGDEF)-like protein
MSQRRQPTLIFVAFILFVCSSLLVLAGWQVWEARVVQLGEMNTAADNLSRAMAQQADDVIHEADATLEGIAERVERDGTDAAALERLHQIMVNRVQFVPQINGIFLYDAHGAWIVNSKSVPLKQFNNADREYFIYHRDHADTRTHVGAPIISRSSGQWVIPVSRRVDRPDGSFDGVILATVNISYITDFYKTLDIGREGSAIMMSDDGVLVARCPVGANVIGRDMSGTQIYRAYKSGPGFGNIVIKSSQDGTVRLNSYRPLRRYRFVVVAALSKDEVLADWRHSSLIRLGETVLLVLFVAMFGAALVKEIDRRASAEQAVIDTNQRLAQANIALRNLATRDGLTGLYNRHQFDLTLATELQSAFRLGRPLTLVMLDLDNFKEYNDIYGHLAGDQCLRSVCDTIRDVAGRAPADMIARYGGEEIVLLLPNMTLEAGYDMAEKVRLAIQRIGIQHRGNEFGVVTISAGVASVTHTMASLSPNRLIDAADKALYVSKRGGRNRVSKALSLSLVTQNGLR